MAGGPCEHMPECPTCGRDDFDSEHGVKVHHVQVHGESIAGVILECPECNDEFRVPPSYEERRTFCSQDCQSAHRSRQTGEDNPYWKGGEREFTCSVCGDSFYDRQSHDHRETCSKECQAEYMSERNTGEGNPMWAGGQKVNYRGDWWQNREAALERDGYECRACGMGQEKHREKFNKGLEVHHVVPVKEFDDPDNAHSLGNLVTACIQCHTDYEGLPVFPL